MARAERDLLQLDLAENAATAKKSSRKNKGATIPAKTELSAGAAPDSEQDPILIKIDALLASPRPSCYMEGTIAERLHKSTLANIIAVNQIIYGANRSTLGEIDIHAAEAIIEVTVMQSGKEKQIGKYVTDKFNSIDPLTKQRKAVILFAPNYSESAVKQLPKQRDGKRANSTGNTNNDFFRLIRNGDELDEMLDALSLLRMRTVAKQMKEQT